MITAKKVKAYFEYEGANENLLKHANLSGDEWKTLDELRMALANVKAGNTTEEFARHAMEELERLTDDEETARLLADLA